jgi:hypothetical protein
VRLPTCRVTRTGAVRVLRSGGRAGRAHVRASALPAAGSWVDAAARVGVATGVDLRLGRAGGPAPAAPTVPGTPRARPRQAANATVGPLATNDRRGQKNARTHQRPAESCGHGRDRRRLPQHAPRTLGLPATTRAQPVHSTDHRRPPARASGRQARLGRCWALRQEFEAKDGSLFYYNPYSNSLILDFPNAGSTRGAARRSPAQSHVARSRRTRNRIP